MRHSFQIVLELLYHLAQFLIPVTKFELQIGIFNVWWLVELVCVRLVPSRTSQLRLQLIIFLLESLIVTWKLVQRRHTSLIYHPRIRLTNLICLKTIQVSVGCWELLVRETSLICVDFYVVFLYHFINVLDMIHQSIFFLLYLLIPKHGEESFDVSLGHIWIRKHLNISPSLLSWENVCLAFHYRCFLPFENLTLLVTAENALNVNDSLFSSENLSVLVFVFGYEAFNCSLYLDNALLH